MTDAVESALRAAAREVVEWHERVYGPCETGCECSIVLIKAALDGAPYELSEAEAERAAIGLWRAYHTGHSGEPPESWHPPFTWDGVADELKDSKYRAMARAALKAAWGGGT